MTQVRIRRRKPDGITLTGASLSTQNIRISPTRVVSTDDGELLPIPKTVTLSAGGVILNLLPTSIDTSGGRAWAWIFQEIGKSGGSGAGGKLVTVHKLVPAGESVVDFEDLVIVDPTTLGPIQTLTTAQEMRLRALETATPPTGGGTGGTVVAGFEHQQVTPASTWTIPVAGFTRRPNVDIYVGGEQVDTDISSTTTQVVVTFPAPTAGTAVLT